MLFSIKLQRYLIFVMFFIVLLMNINFLINIESGLLWYFRKQFLIIQRYPLYNDLSKLFLFVLLKKYTEWGIFAIIVH